MSIKEIINEEDSIKIVKENMDFYTRESSSDSDSIESDSGNSDLS